MKNIKTIGIKLAVFTGVLATTLGVVWIMGGTAKADVLTLQQSVEMAQADYDLSKIQARDVVKEYCESWRSLGLAKQQLAAALQIDSPLKNKSFNEVSNCVEHANWYVPDSF